MVARKTETPDAPNVGALLADAPEGYASAPNPERAALALGVNGKRYRALLRGVLGVRVREQGAQAFDERARAYMLVVLRTTGTAQRAALGDAFRSGEDVPVAA